MNIICNNCVGARLYEVTKQQFPNPFMWMTMTPDDFIRLANAFDKLDLMNASFELERYKENQFESVLVTLQDGIKLHYIHYIQDSTKEIPTKEKNTNILYKDIIDYARKKWAKRIGRINEEQTFLYSFNYTHPSDLSYGKILNQLKSITTKKLIVLVHSDFEFDASIFPNNISIIKLDSKIMSLNGTPLATAIAPIIFK